MNREKQGRQSREASVHWKGRTNACHLSGTSDVLLWGLPILRTTLCISPVVPATMREIQNVVCLNAFLLVPPKPHSRQPSLSVLLLGVANREVSQAGESARRLSGRYSLRLVPSTRHSVVSRHLPSRQSAAVSFSEARPQSMRRQKRTAPTTKPSAMR